MRDSDSATYAAKPLDADGAGATVPRIAVVAFDGMTPFHLSVPSLVFGLRSGAGGGAMGFAVRVCAVDPPPLRTTGGFSITPEHDLTELEQADWVIVPTWHDDCRPAPDVLIRALRLAGERGAGLVGLCLGAFPLAQAGLLDGLRATTHWAYADRLAERHPRIRVEREALYVDEGRVLTSAGVAAGLDCCLHLLGGHGQAVRHDLGTLRELCRAPNLISDGLELGARVGLRVGGSGEGGSSGCGHEVALHGWYAVIS